MKWTGKKTSRPLVMTVLGIRPDVIRLAATIERLDAESGLEHVLVHSGQHYQASLSDVFFVDLGVRDPDFNLEIGGPGKNHVQQHADLIVKLAALCQEVKPDLVVFLGDSNTALAAIDLKKLGFPIARIEAGMRAGPKAEWMPEEINRQVADRVASLLFAYTPGCVENLKKEGISSDRIHLVGNTIVESVRKLANPRLNWDSNDFELSKGLWGQHQARFEYRTKTLKESERPSWIAADIHRHEDYQDRERLAAILGLAQKYGQMFGLRVKLLAYPRLLETLKKFRLSWGNHIFPTELMGFKDYLEFQSQAYFVFSSSGTSQEECPLLKVPVIVPRGFTERPESMKAGNSFLLDVSSNESWARSIDWLFAFKAEKNDLTWLGDGSASEKIVAGIKDFLC